MTNTAHVAAPRAPVAQRSEQGTHNPLVAGSNPAGSTPPLPRSLLDQWGGEPPLLIGTFIAGKIMEHWGFTTNGTAYVKKLVAAGTLESVMKPGMNCRFETSAVLKLWRELRR